jgi:hypothetical protein
VHPCRSPLHPVTTASFPYHSVPSIVILRCGVPVRLPVPAGCGVPVRLPVPAGVVFQCVFMSWRGAVVSQRVFLSLLASSDPRAYILLWSL